MKRIMRFLFISLFLLFRGTFCNAEQTVKIALGDSLPPWVIQETDNGIILDILRAALEPEGYVLEPVYVPYARRLISYEQKKADVVCDINRSIIDEHGLEGFLSRIVYAYENVAISLRERAFNISSIRDLFNLSVLGWQGSAEILGVEYARMAKQNPDYSEIARQKVQVKMLLWGRVDVIQMDRMIFEYYRKEVALEEGDQILRPVEIVPLFGQNKCGFLFWDEALQKVFDENWKSLVENGQVEQIYRRYLPDDILPVAESDSREVE